MALLDVDGLQSGYGDLVAVRDFACQVESGHVVALLGRNGAGKTTVLRALAGLNDATRGSVRLADHDVSGWPPYRRVAAGMAMVQEGKRLFKDRTVEENLLLGGHVLGLKRKEMTDRLDAAYQRFEILGERRNLRAAALSGGQQQMLAIAQALIPDPTLLMLDEPSAGLAPSIVADVLGVISDLRDTGMAVLLVEQSVEFALRVADHVVVMDLGHVVLDEPADNDGLRHRIQDAYLARSTEHPQTATAEETR